MQSIPAAQQNIYDRCVHPTGTFSEFTRDELEQSIPDRFEKMARLYPERAAIKTRSHNWTYDQLNRMANRVAHHIRATHDQRERPIAILIRSRAPWLASMLGILKSGNWFVTLDPSHPRARIVSILESAEPALIVTDDENCLLARELSMTHRQSINIDQSDPKLPETDLSLSVPADSMAYVLYTSGSTGTPKGVAWTHRACLHQALTYTNTFHITPDDVVGALSSLGTAQTLSAFLRAGLVGGTLSYYDILTDGLAGLSLWLNEEGVTLLWIGVPIFRHFVRTLRTTEKFPAVRLVRLGSDRATKRDFDLYKKHFAPTCILVHGLGMTEAGMAALYLADQQTELKGSIMPVGYPARDKEVLLLDDLGQECSDVSTGEIAIRSRYIASGYWRDPELTRIKFVEEPGRDQRVYRTGDLGQRAADGCLTFLGRKDARVKVRGFTVDVAEIESALLEHSGVKEAVVKGVEDPTGERQLVGYIVPQASAVATSALRSFLRATLPDHMIPTAFVMMDAFPVNPAGKIDR